MARTKVSELTHERLTQVLDYDPATGWFVWKVSPSNSVKLGARAGVLHQTSGGRYVNVDGNRVMAHRLAWFYVKGVWPEHDLRPINGDFDDCRVENFVDTPRIQIAHKRSAPRTNTSGYLGVSRSKRPGKWQAAITWNYKQINLGGNFETAEEAADIYNQADARFKEAQTDEDRKLIVQELRLFRRQRAAWKHLQRSGQEIGWTSFEQFSADIKEIPHSGYALFAEDLTKPVGPGNFKWALPLGSTVNSSKDRINYVRARDDHNREHYRAKHLKREYGADYAYERKLLVEQNGLCAICQKPEELTRGRNRRQLSLDHNHTTGALRGLLCGNCNLGVGYLCDDPALLRSAIAYLEKYAGGLNVVPFKTGEESA